ncbi:MAG: glutaminyl-peptide cyclotransferase [Chloroflexi bacterium]|nr:glutaminyl-peptide cyclotransferase [Chloroflexota bacterium]
MRQFQIVRLVVFLAAFLVACTAEAAPTPTLPPVPTPTEAAYLAPAPTATEMAYPAPETAVPLYTYEIIHAYDHDPNSFTQGLIFEDGIFYEGSGLYGESTLRKVDVETGAVLQFIELPDQYFGEGITAFDGQLIQLTWKAQTGFVYDKDSFELLGEFNYPTQGWGITHDGERLIMSDGSAVLYFWDPETLAENGRVTVRDENGPVVRLNELEYVEGEVWANVWQTNMIARIDPVTGQVVGWIDLTGLLNPADVTQKVDVLNGIAYDDETDRLFVAGKWWPKLYEIELVPLD